MCQAQLFQAIFSPVYTALFMSSDLRAMKDQTLAMMVEVTKGAKDVFGYTGVCL
jgi:hypothetical protein